MFFFASDVKLLAGARLWTKYGRTVYAKLDTNPVLTQGMALRLCYAMSGTDLRYGATRRYHRASRHARAHEVCAPSSYACATRNRY
eukprot:617848-Rhodomonas_salina.2